MFLQMCEISSMFASNIRLMMTFLTYVGSPSKLDFSVFVLGLPHTTATSYMACYKVILIVLIVLLFLC